MGILFVSYPSEYMLWNLTIIRLEGTGEVIGSTLHPLTSKCGPWTVASASIRPVRNADSRTPSPPFHELESALLQDPQVVCTHICISSPSAVLFPEFEKHSFSLQMVSGGIWTSELLWPWVGWVPGWHAHPRKKPGSQTMWTDSWGIKSIKVLLSEKQGMDGGQGN